jgi:hypothetical protein
MDNVLRISSILFPQDNDDEKRGFFDKLLEKLEVGLYKSMY